MHRCEFCGTTFKGRRDARTCSPACRQRRARKLEPEAILQRAANRSVRASLPDVCECCGAPPSGRGLNLDHRHDNNLIRGWLCTRCNIQVSVLDLQFTDPERFAQLRDWSMRGAPAVRVQSKHPKRRRARLPDPALFGGRT